MKNHLSIAVNKSIFHSEGRFSTYKAHISFYGTLRLGGDDRVIASETLLSFLNSKL